MTEPRRITVESVETAQARIRPEATAADLLKRCRAFFEDPENERAFEEWKNKKAAGVGAPTTVRRKSNYVQTL